MSRIFCINKSNKKFVFSIAIPLIAFWMVLYALGYPSPGVDDLYFIGAAINISEGGNLVNPLLQNYSPFKMFFYHPPFHQYTLAGWLYLFGTSTNSLLLFQTICYIATSISTALVLQFSGFQRYLVFPITILLASWMYYMGLRPEALCMAYLMMGIVLLTRRTYFFNFLGFVLLGASICSYPVTLAYAFPFSLLLVISNLRDNGVPNRHYLLKTGGVLLGAMVLIGLLFLLFIHFDVSGFISVYKWHISLRRIPVSGIFPALLEFITFSYGELEFLPLYILFGTLLFILIKNRKNATMRLQYIMVAIISGMIINLILYVSNFYSYFNFFCWVGVILMISKLPLLTWQRGCFIALTLCVFLMYDSRIIIMMCRQKATPSLEYKHLRDWTQQNKDKQYEIDYIAARYVFDYRLPDNTTIGAPGRGLNINPLKPQMKSLKQKKSDRVWIFSSAQSLITELADYQRVKLLGVSFNSIPKKPHDIILVE